MELIEITEQQARRTIDDGELPEEIRAAATAVAVILTQDWCPQFTSMDRWLASVEDDPSRAVFVFKYNLSDLFAEFMRFKETRWKNDRIPYVRYYRNGEFIHEGNYAPKEEFLEILEP